MRDRAGSETIREKRKAKRAAKIALREARKAAGLGALAAAPSIPNHTCRYRSPEEEMAAREEALTEQTRVMRFARRSSAGTSSGTAIRLPLTARRSWFAANC